MEAGSLALGSRMRRLSERLFNDIDQVYAQASTQFQSRWFPVFRLLTDGGEHSITEISRETELTHPAVIQICRRLQSADLILSCRDPSDERRRLLRLSPSGHLKLAELQPLWQCMKAVVDLKLGSVTKGSFLDALETLEKELPGQRLVDEILALWRSDSERVDILNFKPEFQPDFHRLNVEWLEQYFKVEPIDETVLNDPQSHIVDPGGTILFARRNGEMVGTCALKHQGGGVYELTKMGVTTRHRGAGIGRRLLRATIGHYQRLDGTQLYLETNQVLKPAIRLYEQCGFQHQSEPRPGSPYERSNVYMIWADPDRACRS